MFGFGNVNTLELNVHVCLSIYLLLVYTLVIVRLIASANTKKVVSLAEAAAAAPVVNFLLFSRHKSGWLA